MEKFIVEVSARHAHLAKEDVEILFGKGKVLTKKRDLSQPGQFLCNEKVKITTENGEMNMSIIGPERPVSQVEISATDARTLKINCPIRESGDITNSPGCKLSGSAGEVTIPQGVVIAKRHVHLSPDSAQKLGVEDKQIIWVKIETKDRSTIFGDVVARVSPSFDTAMHIDTDESNAAGISGEVYGDICK